MVDGRTLFSHLDFPNRVEVVENSLTQCGVEVKYRASDEIKIISAEREPLGADCGRGLAGASLLAGLAPPLRFVGATFASGSDGGWYRPPTQISLMIPGTGFLLSSRAFSRACWISALLAIINHLLPFSDNLLICITSRVACQYPLRLDIESHIIIP